MTIEKQKKIINDLREAFAKPKGKPVKLPPYIPLKPGQSIAFFMNRKRTEKK